MTTTDRDTNRPAADLTLQSTPAQAPELTAVELDGETVVYDERTGALHLLDQVATVVWGLLDGQASLAQTGDELAEAFGAEPAQVRSDVLVLAQGLGAKGLLAGIVGEEASEEAGAAPRSDEATKQ